MRLCQRSHSISQSKGWQIHRMHRILSHSIWRHVCRRAQSNRFRVLRAVSEFKGWRQRCWTSSAIGNWCRPFVPKLHYSLDCLRRSSFPFESIRFVHRSSSLLRSNLLNSTGGAWQNVCRSMSQTLDCCINILPVNCFGIWSILARDCVHQASKMCAWKWRCECLWRRLLLGKLQTQPHLKDRVPRVPEDWESCHSPNT